SYFRWSAADFATSSAKSIARCAQWRIRAGRPDCRRESETLKGSEAIPVPGGIAERHLRAAHALEVEPNVVLVGHADAAVHLHSLVAGEHRGIRTAGLGDRDERARVARSLIERGRRTEHCRTRKLELDEDLRRAVLERLEAADRNPELLPRL